MKRKALTAVCCLGFISSVLSQDPPDSVAVPDIRITTETIKAVPMSTAAFTPKNNSGPFITIKGEEFNRFPSTNFMDALSGLFPWIFFPGNDYGNFTYVVNGRVLQDVNGLSLHDIEQVSFDRTNMNGRLYPYSQVGIFYITTKSGAKGKPIISFNTQYNHIWNKDKKLITEIPGGPSRQTTVDNGNGMLQSNHFSVAAGGNKLLFYGSARLAILNSPDLSQTSTITGPAQAGAYTVSANSKQLNASGFINLTYKISRHFTTGLSGNYFHGTTNMDSSGRSAYIFGSTTYSSDGVGDGKIALNYYHVSPYISFRSGRIQNTAYFEYANNEYDYNDNSVINSSFTGAPTPDRSQRIRESSPYTRGYTFRNDFMYELFARGKVKATTGFTFSYINQELRNRNTYTNFENGNQIATGYNWTYFRQKFTTINPSLLLNFNQQFSLYGGHAFLLNKTEDNAPGLTSHSRHSYYGGAELNLRNIFQMGPKVDRLDVTFQYANMTKNASENYWLPNAPGINSFASNSHMVATFDFVNNKRSIQRTELSSIQINSSFLDNRILFGAHWSKTVQQDFFLITIVSPGGFFNTYVPGEVTTKGFAFYTAVKIADRSSFKWTTRFNVLLPKRKSEISYPYAFSYTDNIYTLQAGLQNHFEFGKFYAQVHGLLGTNREQIGTNPFEPSRKKTTDFILNYLMAGYSFSTSDKSFLSKFSVFIQARNLTGTPKTNDYFYYDSYAGAGFQLQLK